MSPQHTSRVARFRCREIPKLCLATRTLRNQPMAVGAEHPDAGGMPTCEKDATRGIWSLRAEVPELHHRVLIAFRWGLLADVRSCHQPARIWAESLVEHNWVGLFMYGQEAGPGRRRFCVDIQELRQQSRFPPAEDSREQPAAVRAERNRQYASFLFRHGY